MADEDIRNDSQAIRRITARVGQLEATVSEIVSLRKAVDGSEKRIGTLIERSDDMSRSLQKLSDTHIAALTSFSDMLQKQRTEHREMLQQQEDRWRASLTRLEDQYIASHERIVEETISQLSGVFVRGTLETLARWLWPGLLAAAIALGGWIYHVVFAT
jgi:chromosome segregation ATPase